MVFPVVMYRYENWTIQKDWALKDWYFQTLVLEKTVESPLDARRSNQSILKDINPEYSLVGLMLKVKLQYFGHLMGWANSLKKTLMLRKIEGRRRRGHRGWDGWMVSMIQWRWVWTNSRREGRPGKPGVLQFTGSQTVRHDLATEQQQQKSQTRLSDWMTRRIQYIGLPMWLSGKESACNAGDVGSILESGRCPGERKWQPTPVFLPG